MADSIEDLLTQLKAKYGSDGSNEHSDDASQPSIPPNASNASPSDSPNASSTDSLSNPQLSPNELPQPPGSIDSLLDALEGRSTSRSDRSTSTPTPAYTSIPTSTYTPNPVSISSLPDAYSDSLLAQLKAEYAEQDQLAEQQRQQQIRAEQQQQKRLQQERRAAIVKQAEAWLETLDPRGGEGAWFEEFAAKYSSRLEAAIDYLGLHDPAIE